MAFAVAPTDAVAVPTARGGLLSGRPWVSGKPLTGRGAAGVRARPVRRAAVRCSALPVSAESDYKLKEVWQCGLRVFVSFVCCACGV